MIETNVIHIKEGHLVAVLSDDPTWPPPWIAEVKNVQDDDVTVIWYEGSYTTTWKPAKIRNGRHMEDWVTTVSKSSIILYDFKLTSTGRLRKSHITHLQKAYSDNATT